MADGDRKPAPRNWANLSEPEREIIRDQLRRGTETSKRNAALRKAASAGGSGDIPIVDPASIGRSSRDSGGTNGGSPGDRDGGGGEPRTSGSWWRDFVGLNREKGTTERKSERASPRTKTLDLSGVEGLLHSIFLVLAIRAGNHWELSEDEATQLSKAVANVCRHYPVARTQKAADWSQLILVCAVLGGPRVVQSMNLSPSPSPAASPGLGHNGGPPLAPSPGTAARPAAATPTTPPAPFTPQTPSQLDPASMAGSHMTAGRA